MIELNTREAKRKWFAVNKIWFIVKEINPPFQRQTNFAEDWHTQDLMRETG